MFYAGNPPHIQPIGAGIIAGAFGLPFAGVHFCAWHFEFPSRAEQWLWRIGCLLMIGCPLAASPTGIYAACYKKRKLSEFTGYFRNPFAQLFADIYRWEPTHQTYMLVHAVVLIPLYIIARWVVIVVAFTTLRSLHPSAVRSKSWIYTLSPRPRRRPLGFQPKVTPRREQSSTSTPAAGLEALPESRVGCGHRLKRQTFKNQCCVPQCTDILELHDGRDRYEAQMNSILYTLIVMGDFPAYKALGQPSKPHFYDFWKLDRRSFEPCSGVIIAQVTWQAERGG
ncbi:hypothetical protein DL93DRAFT_1768850 [Clavulina sp. PMI_390]|nr:hypothetical protein DL93DRAFT_1768850 [Clavulina sp. PMI_390]